jgi:hypothetical protein
MAGRAATRAICIFYSNISVIYEEQNMENSPEQTIGCDSRPWELQLVLLSPLMFPST